MLYFITLIFFLSYECPILPAQEKDEEIELFFLKSFFFIAIVSTLITNVGNLYRL